MICVISLFGFCNINTNYDSRRLVQKSILSLICLLVSITSNGAIGLEIFRKLQKWSIRFTFVSKMYLWIVNVIFFKCIVKSSVQVISGKLLIPQTLWCHRLNRMQISVSTPVWKTFFQRSPVPTWSVNVHRRGISKPNIVFSPNCQISITIISLGKVGPGCDHDLPQKGILKKCQKEKLPGSPLAENMFRLENMESMVANFNPNEESSPPHWREHPLE